jgi:hypothetical protein
MYVKQCVCLKNCLCMGKRSGQLGTVLDDLSKSASRTRKTFSKNKSAVWVNHRIGIHWKYLSSSRSPSPVYACMCCGREPFIYLKCFPQNSTDFIHQEFFHPPIIKIENFALKSLSSVSSLLLKKTRSQLRWDVVNKYISSHACGMRCV